ncbi:lariat debranching enzyme, C-terminal domain-containing protein [Melampsora americana]|nr:lariat debranching enzyme, C-terminal domain-containing protein [Melampsora americana]
MASNETSVMKVAIEGCCHGELDNIYATIDQAVKQTGSKPPDLLICCGDFQSFRNRSDLNTFAAPVKYRQMGDFWKYYKGEKVAPILTVFVGGNHEASGYLWELFHGGWAAPNIYFLGVAGSVILKKTLPDGKVHKVRISGASGIYKRHDYKTGYHERLPYDNSTMRSIYHIRQYASFRLSRLPISPCDIFVSHDWPVGIEKYGNTAQLIRAKPFFRDEIASNTLGSPPLMEILQTIKPSYWFSAHLHVKFAALMRHGQPPASLSQTHNIESRCPTNPEELEIDVDDSDTEGVDGALDTKTQIPISNPDQISIVDKLVMMTRFLALDKCMPRKDFLQIIDIPLDETNQEDSVHPSEVTMANASDKPSVTLHFDPHWLAITRAFHPHLPLSKYVDQPLPMDPATAQQMIDKELQWIEKHLEGSSLEINGIQQFTQTAPALGDPGGDDPGQPFWYTNPQTVAFTEFLQISNKINPQPAVMNEEQ